MLDFAKKMAIKAIQKQAAPFLTAHCPESLQPRLAELLADEQAISSLLSYLYDVGAGNKSFSLKELDFLPISSGSNSELLNYVVPSLVSKLPIKLSPSSRFGAEIKKMIIKLLQSQAAPYLLKKCPSALQAPLAQLLSDDVAISSIMSYVYDVATGEASFCMDTLQQLPMTPATRKTLSTPGLLKHVFTSIKPLLSSLPGKLSLPVPEEVSFTPADSPAVTDIDTTPESTRNRSFDAEQIGTNFSDDYTGTSNSGGKIRLLPTLVAGGLTLSGLLSTFYTIYYAICYTPSVAYSLSAILGYVVLIAGLFMGYRWILKPHLRGIDCDQHSGNKLFEKVIECIIALIMCSIIAVGLYYVKSEMLGLVGTLLFFLIMYCSFAVEIIFEDNDLSEEVLSVGFMMVGAILGFLQVCRVEWISEPIPEIFGCLGVVFYLMFRIFRIIR